MTAFSARPLQQPLRQTQADARQDAATLDMQRPGFFQAVYDAASSEWAGSWLYRQYTRSGYTFDPDYRLDEEGVKKLGEGLDPSYWELFGDAVSYPHALRIRDQALGIQQTRQRLASLGWQGTALRLGAAILDPVQIAADVGLTVATGGIGAGPVAAKRASTLARMTRGGLIAAGSAVPIQAYISSQDPEQGAFETLLTAGGAGLLGGLGRIEGRTAATVRGAAIGGAVGAPIVVAANPEGTTAELLLMAAGTIVGGGAIARSGAWTDAVQTAKRQTEASVIIQAMGAASQEELKRFTQQVLDGHVLTEKGKYYFRKELGPEAQQRVVDDLIAASGIDDADDIAALREMAPELAMQKLVAPGVKVEAVGGIPVREGMQAGDFDLTSLNDAKSAFGPVRFSMAGALGQNKSAHMRAATNAYAQDALLKADGTAQNQAGSEWTRVQYTTRVALTAREVQGHMDEWMKSNGRGFMFRASDQERFWKDVGAAVRQPADALPPGPVKSAADAYRRSFKDLRELAQRHGVAGFDEIAPNATYLPRIHNYARLDRAIDRYGVDEVARLYAEAMVKYKGSTDAHRLAIAKGYVKILRDQMNYTDFDRARMFTAGGADILARAMRDADIDEATIGEVVARATALPKDAGKISSAKRRLELDENYGAFVAVKDEYGGGRESLRITDLLEDNAELIYRQYARSVVGASAEAEILRAMSARMNKGDTPFKSWDSLKDALIRDMREAGESEGRIKDHIGKLDLMRRATVGMQLHPTTAVGKFLRAMRSYNHIRLSGQFGIAQVPELGNVVGEMGIRAFMQQIPAFRDMNQLFRSGKAPTGLLAEIEASVGLGTDNLVHSVVGRFDRTAAMDEFGGGKLQTGMDRVAHAANQVSLMAPVNRGLQLIAGASAAQNIANQAWSGRIPKPHRLAQLGLTEAKWNKIAENIRTHATREKGTLGSRLTQMNMEKWDADAASAMMVSLDRWSRRVIQENDIGNMAEWMTRDWGKALIQFRTFTLVAWEKQLLRRVQNPDTEAFASAMFSMFFAGTAFMAMRYATSVGRPDQAEYLEKELSPERIGAAAFQRAGFSSVIPGIADSIWTGTGGDPIFTARTTGLSTRFIDLNSNPTVNLINTAIGNPLSAVGNATRDSESFNQTDARNWLSILPFRNVIGIKNALDAAQQSAGPERRGQ